MKKVLAVALALVMALPMGACKKSETKKKLKARKDKVSTEKVDVDKIKELDGVMLKIDVTSYELQDPNYDQRSGVDYYVSYDGTLKCEAFYSLSGKQEYSTVLSDSDLIEVFEFCQEYGDGKKLKDYQETANDGEVLEFIYTDEKGKEHVIYRGYCYQNKVLWDLYEMLGNYIRRVKDEADKNPTQSNNSGDDSSDKALMTIDELKKVDGYMLSISSECLAPLDYYNDEARDTDYFIYYNGTIERVSYHSMSDPVKHTVEIPDDVLYDFYKFCVKYGDGKAFQGYSENVCDGEMYYFTYKDENGKPNYIYGGYCYEVQVLQDIIDKAADFFYPDFSVVCQERIGGYEGLLETVTNLSSPEIRKIDTLPDDVVLEPGVNPDSSAFFYEYTYTTTEDAEKGPIVCYVGQYGYLFAMKNNRNWDIADLIIEVNGKTLTAVLDPMPAHYMPLTEMLHNGPITIRMDDWKFGKTGYVQGLGIGGANKDICEVGTIIMDTDDDMLRIVTEEGKHEHVVVAKINSVTQDELKEIFGEGEVTVTISLGSHQN